MWEENFVIREQCKFSQKVPPSQTFLTACFINFPFAWNYSPAAVVTNKNKAIKNKVFVSKGEKTKKLLVIKTSTVMVFYQLCVIERPEG